MSILFRNGQISISLTIVTTFVGLVVALLGSVLIVTYSASSRTTLDLYGELAVQTSSRVTAELRNHLDPVVEQVDWTADLIATGVFDLSDDQQLGKLLLGALAATPQVAVLAYISADKRVVRVHRGGYDAKRRIDTVSPSDPSFAIRTLHAGRGREAGFWNEIVFSERFKRSYVNYVRPVRRDGKFKGVVLAAVSLNELSDLVTQISNWARGTVFILAEKNRVIAHPNLMSQHPDLSKASPTVAIGRVGDPVLAEFWKADTNPIISATRRKGVVLRQGRIRDQRYIFAHVEIEGYGDSPWIAGHHLDAETAGAALRSLRRSAIIGLAILVAGIGFAILVGRRIAGPIRAASVGSALIAQLEISQIEELPRSPIAELDMQARSFNAMLAALRWFQIYVPHTLVRYLVGRGDQEIASEKRDLTIVFTDLVGFTTTSETMSADETADLLNHHFGLLTKCVEDEDGTIDKFIGDALMAFWGAPNLQLDQADRAVRAVCAMAQAVQNDNALRQSQELQPIRIRIGLHSGPAVIGNIGAPTRMNYTIVGDTVNTAQRMEGLGKEIAPDADVVILASETVIAAVTASITAEPVGAFAVKGRVEPVQVFQIFP